MKLTQEELKYQLDYNHLTGIFTWKIKPSKKIQIGDIAGTKNVNGYIYIGINNKRYRAHRLAWFHYYGYMPENDIDHKDQIKHHNWIKNLREATRFCNMQNRGNRKDNILGIKGVCLHKLTNKWIVRISTNRKEKYLGLFKDFDEAVCHRLAAEQCLDWSNCDSSSPAFQYVRENIQNCAKA